MAIFTLTIETGNEAMQTYEDVVGAIVDASQGQNGYIVEPGDSTVIYDANGNRVGQWEVTE